MLEVRILPGRPLIGINMSTIVVWLLIAVSDASYNYGTTTVVSKHADQRSCEFVRDNIPSRMLHARCIQTTIVKDW